MIKVPKETPAAFGEAGLVQRRGHYHKHHHAHHHQFSRRQFLQASAAVTGLTLAGGLVRRVSAHGRPHPGRGIPTQLPDYSPVLKDLGLGEIPFFLPVEIDPFIGAFDPVANPTTMWDFRGYVGVVEAEGVSDAAHNSDGVPRTWAADVRYMTGHFVDRTGRRRRATFAFF